MFDGLPGFAKGLQSVAWGLTRAQIGFPAFGV